MKLLAALALVLALGTSVSGIKCDFCLTENSCSTVDCGGSYNRCFTSNVTGVVTRGCLENKFCDSTVKCCIGDLCNANPKTTAPKNNAPLTLPPVLLLGLTAFNVLYMNQD